MFMIMFLAILRLCHADHVQPKNVFILAGQSNMAGRGGVINGTWNEIVPLECKPNHSVFRLTANLTWEEAKEPLHRDIDLEKVCGVGPGMVFANSILQMEPVIGTIGLVPCAIGGTYINDWKQGSILYNRLIERARVSATDGGVIRAMLWYQGESDAANTTQDASSYGENLQKFLNDVRTDLGLPTLPIIQVALASGGKYMDVVRKAQLGIDLPNVKCVDALGLELNTDNLHLTTQSQVLLGKRLARAFLIT